MKSLNDLLREMTTWGTPACGAFCGVIGIVVAVLLLTIAGGADVRAGCFPGRGEGQERLLQARNQQIVSTQGIKTKERMCKPWRELPHGRRLCK